MKKPSVIITGFAGFIGSNLARELVARKYEVYGIDNLKFGNEKNITDGIPHTFADFHDIPAKLLNTYDVLVHCATSNIIYAIDHTVDTFKNNALNTIRLFQKFKGRVVYTSTTSVYDQAKMIPTPETAEILTKNAYDGSKFISELFLQERGHYTTLRLSNVYGRNQRPDHPYAGVIGKFLGDAMSGNAVKIIGDGRQSRDFTHIKDVVQAIIMAIEQPSHNDVFNIASGMETKISDLAQSIFATLNILPKYEFIEKRAIDGIQRRCLDVRKAKKVLGWEPRISLHEGLERTIAWMKSEKI